MEEKEKNLHYEIILIVGCQICGKRTCLDLKAVHRQYTLQDTIETSSKFISIKIHWNNEYRLMCPDCIEKKKELGEELSAKQVEFMLNERKGDHADNRN